MFFLLLRHRKASDNRPSWRILLRLIGTSTKILRVIATAHSNTHFSKTKRQTMMLPMVWSNTYTDSEKGAEEGTMALRTAAVQ
jgi:hypothetical protein